MTTSVSGATSASGEMPSEPMLSASDRSQHHRWLAEITQIPTAAGKEQRVIAWIKRWVAERPGLVLREDRFGNLTVLLREHAEKSASGTVPIYITAHLDHPAFVVEKLLSPTTLELSFRGGVMDEYFVDAKVAVFDQHDRRFTATLRGEIKAPALTTPHDASASAAPGTSPFKHYTAELDGPGSPTLAVGDVAVWDLPPAEVIDGCMHTLACDDLAALAAAVSAYDVLASLHTAPRPEGEGSPVVDVRLLFTRAEEIGFIGAIAACREMTLPQGALVLALENSRSFPHDSPIHAGPIVRVGDRLTIFTPALTDAVAKRAEAIAGGASTVTASQKLADLPKWKWQRKLMAGGACEATVFCAHGYDATCICLPLGNYHNMASLAEVQGGTNTTPPRVGREFIGLDDYDGLVDLLIACGTLSQGKPLVPSSGMPPMIDRLWNERAFVLGKMA